MYTLTSRILIPSYFQEYTCTLSIIFSTSILCQSISSSWLSGISVTMLSYMFTYIFSPFKNVKIKRKNSIN